MFNKLCLLSLVAVAAFSSAMMTTTPAQATLVGDTINGHMDFIVQPNINFFRPLGPVVVGPGVEYMTDAGAGPNIYSADFGASTLEISIHNPQPINQFFLEEFHMLFTDLDWVGMPGTIVDLVLDPGSDFAPTSVVLGPDSIDLVFDLSSTLLNPGQTISALFDIQAAHVQVPEPETYLSLGTLAALALFAGYRRRKTVRINA